MTYSEAEKILQTLPESEMIFDCEMVTAIVPQNETEYERYVNEIGKIHNGLNVSIALTQLSPQLYSSNQEYLLHWFYKRGGTYKTIEVGKEIEYIRN